VKGTARRKPFQISVQKERKKTTEKGRKGGKILGRPPVYGGRPLPAKRLKKREGEVVLSLKNLRGRPREESKPPREIFSKGKESGERNPLVWTGQWGEEKGARPGWSGMQLLDRGAARAGGRP